MLQTLNGARALPRPVAHALEVFDVWGDTEVNNSLSAKDVPVYATAVVARAQVLLTGDHKHFGLLMERDDLPLRVRSVRSFLIEGAKPRQ